MAAYNRIPISMDKGKAILEYGSGLCRITLQLQGISTDKLYKPYLLWEDSFLLLPKPLTVDAMGRCTLRCEVQADNPEGIRAAAVISPELEVAAIGFVNGEYDWRRCFMLKETAEAEAAKTEMPKEEKTEQLSAQESAKQQSVPENEEKQVFKSIVCRLDDDLKELKRYTQMPQNDNSSALFETHDAVTPFYGCSGQWIKINLRELAQVCSLWKYINNPLVLYACRQYHHLLLGRDGGALILGVPCEYDPSYRLEAEIQGFTDIKPVENAPLEKGKMCYLLMTV